MPRHPPYTLKSLTTFIDHRLQLPPSSLGSKLNGLSPGRGAVGSPYRHCPINNGSTIAKKVLDDVRPTERPKLGWGIHPCRGGHRGGLIFSDEPSVEPQDSFTCQRTLISLLRRLLAAVQSISFPAKRGRVGRRHQSGDWLRFAQGSWRHQPRRPNATAADSFEFGRMSIGASTAFKQAVLQTPSPAPPVTSILRGH